jgi:hypothetical protein
MQKTNPETSGFSFIKASSRAFDHLKMEFQIILLVGLLYSILFLIIPSPFQGSELLNTAPTTEVTSPDISTPEPNSDQTDKTFTTIISLTLILFINALTYVFWCRFLIVGRSNVFKATKADMFHFITKVTWRLLSLMGWIILSFIPLILFSVPLFNSSIGMVIFAIYLIFITITGYTVLGPSALAASIGKDLRLKQSWTLLGNYKSKMRLTMMGIALVFTVIMLFSMELHILLDSIFGPGPFVIVVISFLNGILSMAFQFIWLHITWQLVHHISPDLLSPENKKNETDIVI